MLAVDYALKPVLNALKAQEILHGVLLMIVRVTDYQHKPQFTPNLQGRPRPGAGNLLASAASSQRRAPALKI